MLQRHYHGGPTGWQLVTVIKTGFNSTLIWSQISEIYWSFVHLHLSIYLFYIGVFPSEASKTSSDSARISSHAAITSLYTASTPQMSRLSFVLLSLSRFLSIGIFGVLRVISRVQSAVFPTMQAFQDLDLSSGILRGPGIYHSLGIYCSVQSYNLGHVEHVRPTMIG